MTMELQIYFCFFNIFWHCTLGRNLQFCKHFVLQRTRIGAFELYILSFHARMFSDPVDWVNSQAIAIMQRISLVKAKGQSNDICNNIERIHIMNGF